METVSQLMVGNVNSLICQHCEKFIFLDTLQQYPSKHLVTPQSPAQHPCGILTPSDHALPQLIAVAFGQECKVFAVCPLLAFFLHAHTKINGTAEMGLDRRLVQDHCSACLCQGCGLETRLYYSVHACPAQLPPMCCQCMSLKRRPNT